MRARVTLHRQKLLRLHAQDPYQWTAVFNERKQEVEFFSPHFPDAFVPPSDCYSAQPPTYAMLADDFLLYHALLVQDAYRKFHRRRRRQRRVRGLLKAAFYCVLELLVTRRRLFLRSDATRKRSLNRLRVVVHRANHLRAGDLLTSDPYVIMTLTDATGEVAATDETSVRYNSLNPKWDEEFLWRYSFVDHERQQTAARSLEEEERPLQDAVLTLRVFDFDVVRARKYVSVKQKLSSSADEESEEWDDAVESAASKHKSAHDFLGMATVPIETFAHGKCMTADLPLLDENGIADDSTRPRGSLTVSVHWLHCEDEEEVAHGAKLWAVGAGGGRSLAVGKPTKPKPKPKPQLSDEAAVEVLLLRNQMELLLQLLLNTATDALEPLQRLHKRLLEAQATGAMADEAKVVEQRMDALLHSQLLPKLRLVRELAASGVGERLGIVTRKLREPVEDYITSFEQKARLDLRATVERSFGGLQVTTQLLQVQPPESVDCVAAMELAMAQRRRVSDWNDQLRQVLGTFFVGEGAGWRLPLEEQVAERYERLESIGSSPSGIVAAEISTRPATARPPPASTGASTPVRPSTAATVAKRKDRIAKAKQQKRWYQM
ncbi:hypothetical protein BBJ28_00025166 [Nothophytophthora sp. Chile5]|nr:hypothetical protein BBJ28_00025166 [Nothophytophthora sp. Chile5]